jgi:hypothetical protein
MAKRLSVKRSKQAKDRMTAHKKDPQMQECKVANARSKKTQAKKINRAR